MAIDIHRIRAITFDCYGTLIDWETGLLRTLRPALAVHGVMTTDDAILEAFASLEQREEAGPFKCYRDVLREVMAGLGEHFGVTFAERQRESLAESIARWPAFADTPEALARLGKRFYLNIISNIDDDLFELSRPKLGAAINRVVTAEYCRSYKPSRRNFKVMLALLDLDPPEVLHVAQSLFHDIIPARDLGFQTMWVNRRAGKTGSGATPPAEAIPDLELASLADVAACLTVKP